MSNVFRDTEELAQALRHTNVSAMQASPGRFQATLSYAFLDGWSLQFLNFQEGASICQGDAPREHHAFVVPIGPAGCSRLLGRELSETTLGVYAPGSEHADATQGGCEEVVVVAPKSRIGRLFECGADLPLSGSGVREADPHAMRQLRNLLCGLRSNFAAQAAAPHENAQKCASEALFLALSAAVAPRNDEDAARLGRPKLPRAAVLRRIAEILDAPAAEPIRASELAQRVGISQPSLQRVFHEWFGMPPAQYLTMRRLYEARHRLRDGSGQSVTDVAASLGFWDLSRFSRRYRAQFGELPSQTRKQPKLSYDLIASELRQNRG